MKNLIKEKLAASGFELIEDNRNRYVKNLNMLLDSGLFKLTICEKGMSWVRDDSKPTNTRSNRYNVIIRGGGYIKKVFVDSIDKVSLLQQFGWFLKDEKVRENIKASVTIPTNCAKCQGIGIIPAFHYYCSGICFDCCGTGFDFKTKTSIELLNK
jgi:hypothetical protein